MRSRAAKLPPSGFQMTYYTSRSSAFFPLPRGTWQTEAPFGDHRKSLAAAVEIFKLWVLGHHERSTTSCFWTIRELRHISVRSQIQMQRGESSDLLAMNLWSKDMAILEMPFFGRPILAPLGAYCC